MRSVPCVYRFLNAEGEVIYVGQSKNGRARMTHHAKQKDWWGEVNRVDIEHLATDIEAIDLENRLIKQLAPKYNQRGGIATLPLEEAPVWVWLLRARRMSLAALARELGVPKMSVSKWARGWRVPRNRQQSVADALGVPVHKIFPYPFPTMLGGEQVPSAAEEADAQGGEVPQAVPADHRENGVGQWR